MFVTFKEQENWSANNKMKRKKKKNEARPTPAQHNERSTGFSGRLATDGDGSDDSDFCADG